MDWFNTFKSQLTSVADAEKAEGMKKYMKNHFDFLGIPKPLRAEITKQSIKQASKLPFNELEALILQLWNEDCREYQYIALEVLTQSKCWKNERSLPFFEKLITQKSWWDTVDLIASKMAGGYLLNHPHQMQEMAEKWMHSDNLWLQRTSIIFQLNYKANTREDLLFAVCDYFSNQKEFFIKKAIGWALRQYARTNPAAVIDFVHNHPLQALSVKEATKHLK